MTTRHWPLSGLVITTLWLSLCVPTHEQMEDLAELSAQSVHDPAVMPFYVPWTDAEPAARARSTMQHLWRNAADWTAESWRRRRDDIRISGLDECREMFGL